MDVDFLASLGFIHSRARTSIKPEDDVGNAIKDFFDSQYNDNITYKLFLSAEYVKEVEGFKPYAKMAYKLYETKANFSFDAPTAFTIQSDVTSLSFGSETSLLIRHEESFLSLEGYIR